MAREFNGDAANYLSRGTTIVTATPCTMAAWWYNRATSGLHTIMMATDAVGSPDSLQFGYNVDTSQVHGTAHGGGAFGAALSGATGTSNVWHHGAAVFTSSTLRQAYINGVPGSTNVTNITPSGITNFHMGVWSDSAGQVEPWDGFLAECAVWDVALTTAEIVSLANGTNPRNVQPTALVAYWPLCGTLSPEQSFGTAAAQDLTITGSVPQAPHPYTPYANHPCGRARFKTIRPGPFTPC